MSDPWAPEGYELGRFVPCDHTHCTLTIHKKPNGTPGPGCAHASFAACAQYGRDAAGQPCPYDSMQKHGWVLVKYRKLVKRLKTTTQKEFLEDVQQGRLVGAGPLKHGRVENVRCMNKDHGRSMAGNREYSGAVPTRATHCDGFEKRKVNAAGTHRSTVSHDGRKIFMRNYYCDGCGGGIESWIIFEEHAKAHIEKWRNSCCPAKQHAPDAPLELDVWLQEDGWSMKVMPKLKADALISDDAHQGTAEIVKLACAWCVTQGSRDFTLAGGCPQHLHTAPGTAVAPPPATQLEYPIEAP